MFRPRPAQARVLAWRGGQMGVSAVPGSGKTATLAVLAARLVDRINRPDGKGERLVRIHAIGFPVQFADPRSDTGDRFAILMRALCERNGGTFVGLDDFRAF